MNSISTDIFWFLTFITFFFTMMRDRSSRQHQVLKQERGYFRQVRQEFSAPARGKHTEL